MYISPPITVFCHSGRWTLPRRGMARTAATRAGTGYPVKLSTATHQKLALWGRRSTPARTDDR